ncbi:MAG: methyltransferase domain-containing protein [Acidobacteria bacterium]|nr:methyltransferase domain-containing protein [Acidobacteriota bacterium]
MQATAPQKAVPTPTPALYETRTKGAPDGIGKWYQGREITFVMGFAGADWLERPERSSEEQPDRVVKEMNLKPTDVVADVGAGTGYFAFRFARAVPQGKVYAVDLQPEMLNLIETRKREFKAENVIGVQSTEQDARLPANAVDVVFMADVYHEFAYPFEMMQSILKALKPGGRIIQIEYRGEDPNVPIKPLHKMTVKQVRKEQEFVGLKFVEVKNFLPQQHFIVLEKPRS